MTAATQPPGSRSAPDEKASFEIYLAWSDRTLTVPSGQSVLQVLMEAGLPVTPGCQTGACGECAMNYVEGDVVHKDSCLSAIDRAHTFCPCVSRTHAHCHCRIGLDLITLVEPAYQQYMGVPQSAL